MITTSASAEWASVRALFLFGISLIFAACAAPVATSVASTTPSVASPAAVLVAAVGDSELTIEIAALI